MAKHSCALHPLNGFKYWPVFCVCFGSLGPHWSPWALSLTHHLASRCFSREWSNNSASCSALPKSARLQRAVFSQLRHSSGGELHGPASHGWDPAHIGSPAYIWKQFGKQSEESTKNHINFSSLVLTFSYEAGLFAAITSIAEWWEVWKYLKRKSAIISQ